jgi:hypothetical protein
VEDVMKLIANRDAQFMLLAALIIAIGLVVTTVMLNSIIFEGNMAVSAGADPTKSDIIGLMQIAIDETGAAYGNAMTLGGSTNPKISNFTTQTQNFRDNLTTIYALHGEGVNISWEVSNWRSGAMAYFTDNGSINGASNWIAVENVMNSTITVNISSPMTLPFNISITNASGKTMILNFSTLGNLTVNNSQINANITSAYKIQFLNGSNARGNYSITGNTTNGKNFYRARDYVLNSTITLYTSRVGANITIPIPVPW